MFCLKSTKRSGPIPCLNQLDNDLAFDARLAFSLEQSLDAECDSVCDEGFFDQGPGKDQTTHLVRPSSYIIYHGLSVQRRNPTSRLPPHLLLTTSKLLGLCRTSMGRAWRRRHGPPSKHQMSRTHPAVLSITFAAAFVNVDPYVCSACVHHLRLEVA